MEDRRYGFGSTFKTTLLAACIHIGIDGMGWKAS